MPMKDKLKLLVSSSGKNTPPNEGPKELDDYKPSTPPFVPKIITVLTAEIESRDLDNVGIYRLSGSLVKVKQLYKEMSNPKRPPKLGDYHQNELISCLKKFLNDLKTPIMNEVKDELKKSFEDKEKVKQIINKMKEVNRHTLAHLILHLRKVISHSGKNKMTASNIAIILNTWLVSVDAQDIFWVNKAAEVIVDIEDEFWECQIDIEDEFWESQAPHSSAVPTPGEEASGGSASTLKRQGAMRKKQKGSSVNPHNSAVPTTGEEAPGRSASTLKRQDAMRKKDKGSSVNPHSSAVPNPGDEAPGRSASTLKRQGAIRKTERGSSVNPDNSAVPTPGEEALGRSASTLKRQGAMRRKEKGKSYGASDSVNSVAPRSPLSPSQSHSHQSVSGSRSASVHSLNPSKSQPGASRSPSPSPRSSSTRNPSRSTSTHSPSSSVQSLNPSKSQPGANRSPSPSPRSSSTRNPSRSTSRHSPSPRSSSTRNPSRSTSRHSRGKKETVKNYAKAIQSIFDDIRTNLGLLPNPKKHKTTGPGRKEMVMCLVYALQLKKIFFDVYAEGRETDFMDTIENLINEPVWESVLTNQSYNIQDLVKTVDNTVSDLEIQMRTIWTKDVKLIALEFPQSEFLDAFDPICVANFTPGIKEITCPVPGQVLPAIDLTGVQSEHLEIHRYYDQMKISADKMHIRLAKVQDQFLERRQTLFDILELAKEIRFVLTDTLDGNVFDTLTTEFISRIDGLCLYTMLYGNKPEGASNTKEKLGDVLTSVRNSYVNPVRDILKVWEAHRDQEQDIKVPELVNWKAITEALELTKS